MICPHCKANLVRPNSAGEPVLRTRALIFKAESIVAACPKCGNDVPFSPDAMHTLHRTAVLFFQRPESEIAK